MEETRQCHGCGKPLIKSLDFALQWDCEDCGTGMVDEATSSYTPDYEVAGWEIAGTEFKLYVCSQCGFISSAIINHGCDGLQDNWELNVKCFRKPDKESKQ